jgi:hypothetical protein
MNQISGFALFCEDIRDETRGTETLVGVLAGGLLLSEMPFKFHKLGIYVRLQFARDWSHGPIQCVLLLPGGESIEIGLIDKTTFEKNDTPTNDDSLTGVTLAVVRSVEVKQAGILSVVLRFQGSEITIGNLEVATSK